MKFRDPKTGEVFENIFYLQERFCPNNIQPDERTYRETAENCMLCPIGFTMNEKRETCDCFCKNYPAEAARLMGYDVIDDSSTEIDEKPTDAPTTIDDTPTVSCDTTTEEDEMKCYRNGGCGPYEQLSCGECPASKPEYKSEDDEGKTKQDKPRLAEVLGVEEDEEWKFPGITEKFRVHDGYLESKCDGKWPWSNIVFTKFSDIINHPESIIRAPRLTEKELTICKDFGAKWVCKATEGVEPAMLCTKNVLDNSGHQMRGTADDVIASVWDKNMFTSLRPGDCICVEEAQNIERECD